jgi:hypothetical protein
MSLFVISVRKLGSWADPGRYLSRIGSFLKLPILRLIPYQHGMYLSIVVRYISLGRLIHAVSFGIR